MPHHHVGGDLVAIGVHFVPRSLDERRNLLEEIRRALPRWDCGVWFIGGDFNSVVEGEGGLRIRHGTFVNATEPEERLFSGTRLTELAQPDYTRLGMWDGSPRAASRIDRWCCLVDVPSLLD